MRQYIFKHPWVLAFSAVTGGILQGLMVYKSFIIRDIVDAMVAVDRSAFLSRINTAVVIIVLAYVFTRISARMFFAYSFKSKRTLEKDFFSSVMDTKISDFNQGNSAKYISVMNHDISQIGQLYFTPTAQFSKDALSVILAVVAMAIISPVNALIAVATAFLPLIAPILYGKKLAVTQLAVSTNKIEFNEKVKDYLTGFEVIKTFGVEKNIAPRFYAVATQWMRSLYRAGAVAADVGALTVVVVFATMFLNYFVAGWFVFTGSLSVGGVVAIVALSSNIMQHMTLVSNHISSIRSAKEIGARVIGMMEQRDTQVRPEVVDSLMDGVRLDNVTYAYHRDGALENGVDKPPAVRDFSYTFKRGGKYAIVGASGSGKSTLARLVLGYYDDYKGSIALGGTQMRDINRESLYRVVATLPQNVFMLDDTLRNNVTLFNAYSAEEYETVLRKANLHNVEAALPNGSDTVLGEGGNTLSGGERQRVSIARALLRGSELLVLDEATASLDNLVAHEIESAILDMEDLTCIFVTHRYNAEILRKCDGILVMKDGVLIEHGTYDTLYAQRAYFYSLLNLAG